jgi:hypothetical protein
MCFAKAARRTVLPVLSVPTIARRGMDPFPISSESSRVPRHRKVPHSAATNCPVAKVDDRPESSNPTTPELLDDLGECQPTGFQSPADSLQLANATGSVCSSVA